VTYSLRRDDLRFGVFCFAKAGGAEAFAEGFGGDRLKRGAGGDAESKRATRSRCSTNANVSSCRRFGPVFQKSGFSAWGTTLTHDEPDARVFSAHTASGHSPSTRR
jgi:hypothetical protein